jgi:hypothetical protein
MAQLVAHLLCKQGVTGSSPVGSTLGQGPNTLSTRPTRELTISLATDLSREDAGVGGVAPRT